MYKADTGKKNTNNAGTTFLRQNTIEVGCEMSPEVRNVFLLHVNKQAINNSWQNCNCFASNMVELNKQGQ